MQVIGVHNLPSRLPQICSESADSLVAYVSREEAFAACSQKGNECCKENPAHGEGRAATALRRALSPRRPLNFPAMAAFACPPLFTPSARRSLRTVRRPGKPLATAASPREPRMSATDDEAAAVAAAVEASDESGPLRYMPSADAADPVSLAAAAMCGGARVTGFELLDSRWNGNEVFRYDLDGGAAGASRVFVKMNRVERREVFMSEAVGLTTLAHAADSVVVPRPLHVGALPRVGEYGPGAFMLLEWFDLVPFGANRPAAQARLGGMLADVHLSRRFDEVHRGRFGFGSSNFLGLTPMDNAWMEGWDRFFAKRFAAQVNAAFRDKAYGRAPLDADNEGDAALKPLARRIVAESSRFFEGCEITPSLLHGDLWIGNVGATKDDTPVLYDCACFFGHHELDLALGRMFGGFGDSFWDAYFARIPKAPGFATRAVLYELLQNLNQLNLFGDPSVKEKVFAQAGELVQFLDDHK
jgi:protein-ribulosamine 3-kinase